MTNAIGQDSLKSPPKVLFVVNEAYFFLSHRLELGLALLRRGYEVHVAAPSHHAWAPDKFNISELEKYGFVFHSYRLSRRGKNPFEEIQTLIDLWRLFGSIQPDVAHLLTIKPILYGGLASRIRKTGFVIFGFTGLGQVFTGSGFIQIVLRLPVLTLLRWCLRNRSSVAIAQNSADRRLVAALAGPKVGAPTLIRGSGVDIEAFRATDIPQDAVPVVLFAGRLLWEKGVGTFVQIARELKGRGVVARFVIAGGIAPSNPRSVPLEVLEGWVRLGDVEWPGYCADMMSMLAKCTIFCFPSTYREGVPKVILEAAAAARPLVVSDIDGCREVVNDGVEGLLCAPNDVEEFSDAVQSLLEDRNKCIAMGLAGRRRIADEFGVRQVVENTLEVYDQALSN